MLSHTFSLGRGVAVHKSAEDALLCTDAAPTVRTQYIPPGCFLSHPENRIQNRRNKAPTSFCLYEDFQVGLLVGKTSKWTVTAALMHLTQREKKIENGDCGRKLRKVKSREMVLSEKMMLSGGRKIFCVYGKNSSLIRNRYV